MNNLFEEHNPETIAKFEIIFDRANSEDMARKNAVEYYLCLMEEGVSVDMDLIIEAAENYGYDLSDFETLVEENA